MSTSDDLRLALPDKHTVKSLPASAADTLSFTRIETPGPSLQACYELLQEEFGEDVLDPISRYEDWLELNERGEHAFPYLLTAAYVQHEGRSVLVGVVSGNVMPIQQSRSNAAESASRPCVFAIGHQLTAPAIRSAGIKGFGKRLWQFSMDQAHALADVAGGTLVYSFLEAEVPSVGYWDHLGYRWPQSVAYWQPPLEFDENGDYRHAEVPEIPLLKPLADPAETHIDRDLLYDIIRTIYVNWSLDKYRDRLSAEAFERAEQYVLGSLLGRVDARMPQEPRIKLVRVGAPLGAAQAHRVRSVALSQGIQHGLSPLHAPSARSFEDFDRMLASMRDMAFGARTLGMAADVLTTAARDPDCRMVLTISGAATIAKLDMLLAELVERGIVHCVISTGAAICHGFNSERGSAHFKAPPGCDDVWLFEQGYDRIYDTLEMEYALDEVEDILFSILDKQPEDRALCSSDVTRLLGEYLNSRSSYSGLIGTAYKHDVPILIPAFTDSEIGLDFALLNRRRTARGQQPLRFDPFLDFKQYCDFILDAPRLAILTLGGGVPRNWAQQVGPYLDAIERREKAITSEPVRFQYAVRICPDPPFWGGLSGSTYSEGISWGKFVPEAEGGFHAEVQADYTLVLPLLLKGLFQRLDKLE